MSPPSERMLLSSRTGSTSNSAAGIELDPMADKSYNLSSASSHHTGKEEAEADKLSSLFHGPRDLNHHSRWPHFLRLRGSILPYMIFPLLFVAAWASCITFISRHVQHIGVSQVLLTVLGFVVGLSLSFRNSTAYERYNEGRKYWSQLSSVTQSLARLVWLHTTEREECQTEDLLAKITFCNMLVSLSFALKHRLRHEPFTHYEDLQSRIRHMPIVAHEAEKKDRDRPSRWETIGLFLGFPMAEQNPRRLMKNSSKPLGNVPLEIHSSCSAFIKTIIDNGTFKTPGYHTQAMGLLSQVNDILNGTERILNTPLPLAYSIAIAQITWAYILILPFQLVDKLRWTTVPATMFAAYIILGLALIGREIENPFGDDVNDLPLEGFCDQIRQDIDLIMSHSPESTEDVVKKDGNAVLYPLSQHGYQALVTKSPEEIRALLRIKLQLPNDGKQN
ncbi:UPF0187 domain membrane protein [Metarhizium rileyi]|uniref:UPF0187 domain membrane protein n=1 Tax=Metarhizium rileyi (strain RCEF 4871) TaxID=1649241 RepID=A0A167CZC1_METRR|nr:UPF0187 domain membrane protein [Metarhizium rileyi RCEF 4871]